MNENTSEERPHDAGLAAHEASVAMGGWAPGDRVSHPSKGPGNVRKVRADGKLEVSFSFSNGVAVVDPSDCRKVPRDEY